MADMVAKQNWQSFGRVWNLGGRSSLCPCKDLHNFDVFSGERSIQKAFSLVSKILTFTV